MGSRGPLPGAHILYTSQTKYFTSPNQNGTILPFTNLSKLVSGAGQYVVSVRLFTSRLPVTARKYKDLLTLMNLEGRMS